MVCFLLTKSGLSSVSLWVFGDAEGTEEHEENKEKLIEMLETIHMIIFLVMIIFIVEALGMLQFADWEADKWSEYEAEILTIKQRVALVKKWKELNEPDNKPSDFAIWLGASSAAREYFTVQGKVRFMLMRQEFIHDEANANNALKRDFHFHMYLTKVMGERLGQMIELPWNQWVLLEVFIMLF